MLIHTTAAQIDIDQAAELAKIDFLSLPERLFYFVFKRAYHPVKVLAIKPFYYPYYCCHSVQGICRAHLPDRKKSYSVAMDGCFGVCNKLEGWPQSEEKNVAASLVAKDQLNEADLKKKATEYAVRKATMKFKSPPNFSELCNWEKVYKPMFACLCERRGKRFYRVIDAELRARDYYVEYKFPQINFPKASAAEVT